MPSALIDAIVRVAADHPDSRAVYLFGSQAAGAARPDSDVDVGVLYVSSQPPARTLAFEDELGQALSRRVDVVDVARAAALLALEIVRGERIFCRGVTETDRFDLYVLRRAGDLLPSERERQAMLGARCTGHATRSLVARSRSRSCCRRSPTTRNVPRAFGVTRRSSPR